MQKKICTLSLALLLSWSLYGASEEKNPQPISDKDPLNFQLYGGINKSMNEHLPASEFSSYPWAAGLFVGVAREFHPLWGWRTTLGFDINKSRNVERCETSDVWKWNDVELFADVTFDLTDAIGICRQSQRFNCKLFAGVGALRTWGLPQEVVLSYTDPYSRESTLCGGIHAGMQATYRLKPELRIGCELSQTVVTDGFNGVKGGECHFDGRSNLSIGLTWIPGYRSKRKAEPIVVESTFYPRLKKIPTLAYRLPENPAEKMLALSGRSYLDFPVDETIIYPRYRNNPKELEVIDQTLRKMEFDPKIRIASISLHGYASPESPYSHNTYLADHRTKALKQYIVEKYGVSDTLISTQYTPEDWGNLRLFLASEKAKEQKAVAAHRNELLAVVDGDTPPDEKELQLKRVGGGKPYAYLLKEIYPGLRHTDYVITYKLHSYTLEESRELIYTHPEVLSLHEMVTLANSYPEGSAQRYDILIIAAKQYPNDPTANYNAACASIATKRLKDARRYLRKAGSGDEVTYLEKLVDAMEGKRKWSLTDGLLTIE